MWRFQVFLIFLTSTQAVNMYGPPKEATTSERPFQAAIFKNAIYRCAAGIISPNCVLTACSCIVNATDQQISSEETKNSFTILTFTRYLQSDQFYGYWADASDAYVAAGCNTSNNANDAAILCVREVLKGTPVNIVQEKTKENVRAIVSGWGLSVDGEKLVKNDLSRAYMKMISLEECRRRYEGVRTVPDSALCAVATDEVRGFCAGDFGGPLTHGAGLIGITVTDFGCGQQKYPGIFTNVLRIRKFIEYALTDFESRLEMDED